MKKYYSNLTSLTKIVSKHKNNNKIIGLTNGCFDLLHDGHKKLINESKKNCDYLIVAVNADNSVKKLKGKNRPFHDLNKRIENLKKISSIDAIISFADETPLEIINAVIPDILLKGSDYYGKEIVGSDVVLKNGGTIKLIEIIRGISTTIISKNL
tara:strand:- start:32 stop:496 length:465 start_codon:yes stop_codon:yes gene_type:complete